MHLAFSKVSSSIKSKKSELLGRGDINYYKQKLNHNNISYKCFQEKKTRQGITLDKLFMEQMPQSNETVSHAGTRRTLLMCSRSLNLVALVEHGKSNNSANHY